VFTDVKISNDEIKEVLESEVIKREVFDDEKANYAKKKINKLFKVALKMETPIRSEK